MAGDLGFNVADMYATARLTGPRSTQSGAVEDQLSNAARTVAALKGRSPVHSAPDAEVAVVTPTRLRPDRIAYLLELYASLRDQDVRWQWVLALDGVSEDSVPEVLRTDARVKVVALPRPVGAGAARNFAVNEVTAGWLTTSDDDDVLPAQSLSVRLRYAQKHDLGWCAGWSADLRTDRSITTWRCSTPPGFHALVMSGATGRPLTRPFPSDRRRSWRAPGLSVRAVAMPRCPRARTTPISSASPVLPAVLCYRQWSTTTASTRSR